MVARYSDATKLKQAKFLAREGGCFVVEKYQSVYKNGIRYTELFYLLYRQAEPRNIFISKRSSIDGILSAVKKATASK